MAPKPTCSLETVEHDESIGKWHSHPPPGEEVCISGASGSFPDCANMLQLRENLFNKVDMISDDDRRWKIAHPEIPQRTGKLWEVNKFDAPFFGVHFKQAQALDPLCRVLLEKAYEAIIDAGVNPRELRNTNTGVFIGSSFSESEKTLFYEKSMVNGLCISGCSRAMLANRISYWLGTHGPSYIVDTACSSSLYALEHAYRAIRDGICDAAIVGGSNLCLHPFISLQFSRLGVLSPEGRSRSFDKNANGYVRSETIAVIFLQKAKDARRVYAQVLHAKTNCDGYKEQGITYPARSAQKKLLKELYEECGVNPAELEFIEAHGTGTRIGDPEELITVDEIFCTGRSEPLLIGAVKSNLGHSEPASGLCSVAKMCIAYDTGYLPPNLNYESPREGVDALVEGRMTVVTEKTPWNRGMSGINSFGFGGANAHVLLKNFAKEKVNGGRPKDDLPRLVCVSGRTESAVNRILDDVESRPLDAEQIRLLHAVHEDIIPAHVYRGFILLRPNSEVVRVAKETKYFHGAKRPVWFVFSGMGSQWAGMGTRLLAIPIFAAAIEKCHQVLKPRGIDITRIITDPDPKIYDNILHSFVGIAAVQIGLCDILKALAIEPDFIIGHSVGELGCAYADGCFTAEQMILAAYFRGLASIETPFIRGSMAAVGLGYQTVKEFRHPEIEVACHNGPDSCTVSGPADAMKAFVAQLQAKGTFAKEVPCSNIAYHSRYIAEAGPTLLKYLRQAIPEPKLRSSRWVSTSVPQNLWGEDSAKYSSAEYHTNNLLSPVLFEETSRLIPGNAITIEIAPHGLLQAILNRSLKKDCTNVPLTKRGHPDNVEFLLTAFGKLYEMGLNLHLANIYPKVEFPVSIGTPMLSHLVEWEHSVDWYLSSYHNQERIKSGERIVTMTIDDEDTEFMAGHVIDGRNLFPATGYLLMVWETLGMMMGEMYTEVSVVFEDIRFQRATNIPKEGNFKFIIMIHKGNGGFEIMEGGALIVTGRITAKKDVSQDFRPLVEPKEETGEYVRELNNRDIYKELRLRGYNYSGEFRGIHSSSINATRGMLTWSKNWVTFMDTMLQMKILTIDTRGLFVPTRIEKVSIDVHKHYSCLGAISKSELKALPVTVYKNVDVIRSGGIEIRGLVATPITRRNPLGVPVLEIHQFVPFFPNNKMKLDDVIRTNIQIALENSQGVKVKVLELLDSSSKGSDPLAPLIMTVLGDTPLIQAEVIVISDDMTLDLGTGVTVASKKLSSESNVLFFVGSRLLERNNVLNQAFGTMKENGFIMSREKLTLDIDSYAPRFHIISAIKTGQEQLVLLRQLILARPAKFINIKASDKKFTWVEQVKKVVKQTDKLVLVAQKEPLNGILGLVNCLRREPGGEMVGCIFVVDSDAPDFNPGLELYEDQLDKNLAINVLKNGQWGSYRHLVLEELDTVPAEHAYVNVTTRGDLSSLKWIEGPLRAGISKQLVHIYYSALNFRDVMTSTGKISVETVARGRLAQECVQGSEFSGRTESGARVMGMLANSGMANMVAVDKFMLWPLPDEWSLEEGATVPVTYGTVYYALFIVAKMEPGSTVLIHAGTGGVGQAAINVCLHYGCTIFTTVSTPEKRAFIKKLFPQLTDDHIGNSRDTSFEELVLRETKGNGVDIILNSLAEDKLQASVRCLGYKGRFLEIGKFDIMNNSALGMQCLLRQCSFHGIMLDFLYEQDSKEKRILHNLIYEGIKNGCVKPLCRVVFATDQVEIAFRFMAAGKHIGKVLMKIRDEEPNKLAKPVPVKLPAVPRYVCYPDVSYVIVGGLGGFGLELADWLVLRGARKLVLNSRRGVINGYQSSRIRVWRSYGADVMVSKEDITTRIGCEALLKSASALAPVRAIFNLAVILKDALFENQTPELFAISFGPKALATEFLDVASRKLCPDLKDFVIFSSVSCGRGNAGQTNYGMANSVMERICEVRQKAGLPALAVQWGVVGEVGLVADMQEEHCEMEIGGTLQQRISSCLNSLDQFLKQGAPVVSSMVVAEKRAGGSTDGNIVSRVAEIMGLKDLKTISHQVPLYELGMDSMMSVEIKQCLERDFEIFLTAQEIRTLNFSRLMELTDLKKSETNTSTIKTPDDLAGFTVLMRNIGDEVSAAEPIVNMTTLISNGKENHAESYEAEPRIFMIPGIEGMASAMEALSKRINCKVQVLQPGYDHPDETIEETAQRLLLVIRPRLVPGESFALLGYSYGAAVTLELARLLESEEHTGRIFCMDGSPEFIHSLLKVNFKILDENTLQDALLNHILHIIVPKQQFDLLPALAECGSWESKLELFLNHVPKQVNHSKEYQRALCNVAYGRLKAVIGYDYSNFKKLKSSAILLRPKDCPPGMLIDEDYGLGHFVEQPITVHLVEGNHITILENKDCANIINKAMLDLVEEAASKSTGDIYSPFEKL